MYDARSRPSHRSRRPLDAAHGGSDVDEDDLAWIERLETFGAGAACGADADDTVVGVDADAVAREVVDIGAARRWKLGVGHLRV